MKKIALIEDRYPRQQNFLEHTDINLEEYAEFLENFTEEKANTLLEQIREDDFDLSDFEIIICHKSVQNNTVVLSNLRNYCKDNHKTLVLFSGGISVNYYDNSEFELLELNSKTFYSHNLMLFLEALKSDREDIMMLCYGEHWKQNIVANILEKTNILLNKTVKPVVYIRFANFVDLVKLKKIDYQFHQITIENNYITIEEIKKFQESLENYFHQFKTSSKNNKNLLMHHKNITNMDFEHSIKFDTDDEIDTYITSDIIKELSQKEFDTIFIKDNLSSNYLELYGLRVAYHIRLSTELGDKRFIPIVIISDFDEAVLNGFSKEANILFTEGVYICKNTTEDIKKFKSLELKGVPNYEEFLSSIDVSPPKDTSGSHGIANRWSIYRWAEFLNCKSEAIIKNKNEIENQLYFKYLKALNQNQIDEVANIVKPSKKGKVLLIDDEWDKGWGDILKTLLNVDGLDFSVFEYDYKDKTNFNLIVQLKYKNLQDQIKEADVIILDLRLIEADNEHENLDNYSGVKILEKIHEINAGIQVIMLTATSKSTILEQLYKKKILGYIKKEHPDDKKMSTVENINKFVRLVDDGLKRKYLKDIYKSSWESKDILTEDIFSQYHLKKDFYEQYWIKLDKEAQNIFDIIDNTSKNRFIYAMVSIASSLETILSIFINEREMTFWDDESYDCQYNALRCRVMKLFEKFGVSDSFDMKKLIDKRNDYLHSRKEVQVSSQEIVSWFETYLKMLQTIQNSPNLRVYDRNNLLGNLQDKFNH